MSAKLCHLDENYANAPLCIFGMGPLPRSQNEHSHHQEVFELICAAVESGKLPPGTAYVIPERRLDTPPMAYEEQAAAERRAVNCCMILCWIPRDIQGDMLGLTTNVEVGRYFKRPDFFIGGPSDRPEARKNRYIQEMVEADGRTWHTSTESLVEALVAYYNRLWKTPALCKLASAREYYNDIVPFCIRATQSFQDWIVILEEQGNILINFEVLATYCVGPQKSLILSWRAQVNIFVTSENRNKSNEFIDSRIPFSTTVVWAQHEGQTFFLIVGEFRSPAGEIYYSHPSGSSGNQNLSPRKVAKIELEEETGLSIPENDLFDWGKRPYSTLINTVHTNLFSIKLPYEQMEKLQKDIENKTYGNVEESEITYPVVVTLDQALHLLDAANIGLIYMSGCC